MTGRRSGVSHTVPRYVVLAVDSHNAFWYFIQRLLFLFLFFRSRGSSAQGKGKAFGPGRKR